MIRLLSSAAVVACLLGCPENVVGGEGGGGGGAGGGVGGSGGGSGGGQVDAGAGLTCRSCATSADCEPAGACTQYSGDSFCAKVCATAADCAATEDCALATDFGGGQVRVCLPRSGSCDPDGGCGVCPTGTTCDLTQGTCEGSVDAGPADAGACGTKIPPTRASCCHACSVGSAGCQINGCFGGWWCDEVHPASCSCKAPPTSCGAIDAGTADAGVPDAGPLSDGGLIGPDGGSVNRLFFAVVGDTRPPTPSSAAYPTAIITKIFADIAAMNPRPQFVIGTGDYQFSVPTGNEGAVQLGYYLAAKNQYPGTLFAALGNHECLTPTLSNCVGVFPRNTYDAFLAALVTPLGKSTPYYSIPIQTSAGLASFIVTACNAWDATQKAWLQTQLSSGSTFKIVVRHESLTATAPCSAEMNPMLQASAWNLLLVGHTHLFSHSGKQLIVGMGGAPISGSTPYGYITVEQLAAGGWHVVQYDSTTSMQVSNFTVP